MVEVSNGQKYATEIELSSFKGEGFALLEVQK